MDTPPPRDLTQPPGETLSPELRVTPSNAHYTVLIVGGGTAGVTVAAALRRQRPGLQLAIVEPSETHAYQPGWTLVGGGIFTLGQTQRPEASLIPPGVTWIKQTAAAFHPDQSVVALADGRRIGYRILVVCPGLQLDWDKIDGLRDTLGRNGVCSNYAAPYADYTWHCISAFRGGSALFTQPAMPIKCAGAPQKIMYLMADRIRRRGQLANSQFSFCLSGDALFGVPFFVPPLQQAIDSYGIQVNYRHDLKAIDGPSRTAVFSARGPDGDTREVARRFDMIHVTPPQSAPDFAKHSPLADANGWVDVDPATLRHARYANIFSLGDACSAPNAKTAAAVRMQAPVVTRNVLATLAGQPLPASYDGYGSCPLTVALGKIVLAEFAYGGKVTPSFPLDPRRPRRSAWLLKTKFLPFLYWNIMLKGSELDIGHRERHFADAA